MVKTRKPGPKPKPPDQIRTEQLRIRLLAEELRSLEAAALKLDVDLSTWVRELALKAAHRALAKEA